VKYERELIGKGTLIIIYNPEASRDEKPYWEYEDRTTETKYPVLAGFEVKVVDGWVKLTK
jgi:hypothetical protein